MIEAPARYPDHARASAGADHRQAQRLDDILRSPEAKESLAKLNVLLRPGSPEQFAAFVAKETPVWTEMVRESGATAQ